MELTANFQVANQLGSSMSMPSIINGEDGVTPQLRINEETNLWEVSYDDGATWESLGVKATGAEISTVEQITTSDEDGGENVVRITLTDGRTFDFTTKNGSKGSKGDTGNGIIETIVVDDAVNQKKIVTLTYTDGTSESFDVPYGKDGVSVTHEWEGTTLKVTSASGTSSVDLKGEQGNTPYIKDDYWWIGETDTGVKAKGEDGSGHTPVKGVDYWTEEDKAEMKEFVKNELPTEVSAFNNDAGYLTEVPSEYITESELEAKGYLTEVPSEYITETELEQKGYLTEHQSLDGYAKTEEIPSALSELTDDADHRTVTDTEKTTWNNKVDASTYNTHKADYEEHKADTDIHLGDEIALDDTEHLYIVDSAGNIIAQFDASGLDVAALKLAGIDITDKISTAIADALNGTDNNALQDHINSTDIHVSESDRTTWNNKLDASTYEDFTNEYISHKNDFEAVQIWQQGVAEGTTTVPVADVSNGADGDLKELLNIMIYYAKGYKHSGSGTGTPEATQTTDGYACDVDIEFSSLATVESAELQSYTGFNAEPTVTINGNIVRVSGFSNIAGSSGAGFSLQCGATVSALLAPKVLA